MKATMNNDDDSGGGDDHSGVRKGGGVVRPARLYDRVVSQATRPL